MKINHDTTICRMWIDRQGYTAYLTYEVSGEVINAISTYVPRQIEGQGVASRLMQEFYDYALSQELKPMATCSYGRIWLERHRATMTMPLL